MKEVGNTYDVEKSENRRKSFSSIEERLSYMLLQEKYEVSAKTWLSRQEWVDRVTSPS